MEKIVVCMYKILNLSNIPSIWIYQNDGLFDSHHDAGVQVGGIECPRYYLKNSSIFIHEKSMDQVNSISDFSLK